MVRIVIEAPDEELTLRELIGAALAFGTSVTKEEAEQFSGLALLYRQLYEGLVEEAERRSRVG